MQSADKLEELNHFWLLTAADITTLNELTKNKLAYEKANASKDKSNVEKLATTNNIAFIN